VGIEFSSLQKNNEEKRTERYGKKDDIQFLVLGYLTTKRRAKVKKGQKSTLAAKWEKNCPDGPKEEGECPSRGAAPKGWRKKNGESKKTSLRLER